MIVLELETTTARMRLTGEFDLADLGRIHHRQSDIRGHLATFAAGTRATVILELGDVEFIDCSCLHSLEAFRRELIRRGHTFTIATASAVFLRTARLGRFDALVAAVEEPSEDAGTPHSTAWVPAQRAPGQITDPAPRTVPIGPAEEEPRGGRRRPRPESGGFETVAAQPPQPTGLPDTAAPPTPPSPQARPSRP